MKTVPAFLSSLSALAVIALALVTAPALSAANPAGLQPLADKQAPALPVAVSFEKGPQPEKGGPYILKVKNTSASSLTVHAVIRWSVISHGSAKTIELPPHPLAAGETWAIDELAVEDRITLDAEGFATLELQVPPGKTEK